MLASGLFSVMVTPEEILIVNVNVCDCGEAGVWQMSQLTWDT